MEEKQKEVYEEWLRIERATTLETKVGGKGGHYALSREAKPDDILNLSLVREKVWNELKDLISKEEKEKLGFDLGKDTKEIFDIK